MKIFVLLLLLGPTIGLAQTFEGKIIYANSYKSKSPQFKDQQLNAMMGTKQEYYIKGGDYKSVFNGSFIKMQLYKSVENKSYTLTGKSDSLYSEDYGKNKDVPTKYQIEKSKVTIMGLRCDVLIVFTPTSKLYYYYNKKYGVNPDLFKRHAYGNWYNIITKTKALPLKTIYETGQFTIISTAINITQQKLNNSVFEISDKNKVAPARW